MNDADIQLLKQRCTMQIDEFRQFGDTVQTRDGIYVHKNRNAKILGIAHLDTKQQGDSFEWLRLPAGEVVYSVALDDRLGAFILLDLLPRYGLEFDLLLTTGEEDKRSTGGWFEPEHDYNWMFSFDREGTDVVMYQYENWDMKQLMERTGFTVAKGSHSDIAMMGMLGVKGFNFGAGYYNKHSPYANARIAVMEGQVAQFAAFAKTHQHTKLEHSVVTDIATRDYLKEKWWQDDSGAHSTGKRRGSATNIDRELDRRESHALDYCSWCYGRLPHHEQDCQLLQGEVE